MNPGSLEWRFPDGGRLEQIGSVPVAELARRYGTPTYIYVAESIRNQLERLRKFDVIRYAQKANSNLTLLQMLRRAGVLVDAVSVGEVARAQAAGYPVSGDPPPIIYTADIFDRAALDLVTELGLHVNCGSPEMISQYGQRNPGRAITLRINPGFGHGHSQKTNTGGPQSKHGIWHEDLGACLELAKQFQLQVSGLHMHIGSGADFEHLAQVSSAMRGVARRVGPDLTTISAGGGLPTPYRPGDPTLDCDRYYEVWDTARRQLQTEVGHPLRLELEPGRFPVAEAGYLLTEIRAVKRMGPNLFYLVDAGFNNLARPILYGAYHPMAIASAGEASQAGAQEVIVGGPLCESGDIFTQTDGGTVVPRKLPPAQVGDYLVIGCAGAYGFVMSSNYNSKPLAAEVLVESGQHRLIRPRQSVDELFECERRLLAD